MDLNNLFEMILKLIFVVFAIIGLFSVYLLLLNRYKRKNFEKTQNKIRNSRFLADNLALAPINNSDVNSFHIVKKPVTSKTTESTARINGNNRIQVVNNNMYSFQNSIIKAPYYNN